MAVLRQWNDADEAKSVATCAEDAAVIDDVPPFEWHGPAGLDWTARGKTATLRALKHTGVRGQHPVLLAVCPSWLTSIPATNHPRV